MEHGTVGSADGARVIGVDLHKYDAGTGASFRGELLRRMRRHLPVLMQEPGFERIQQLEQVIDNCSFFTMDAQQLLFRDGLFDFVFSLNAFEHIPNLDSRLQEISRVLKPGGSCFSNSMASIFRMEATTYTV